MKRKVYRMNKAGSIDNLKLMEEDLIPPNDEEVTIEIKSIGLNFADIFAMTGLYSATPQGSFIPGLEYSGIVLQCGKNANRFKIGDKVMGVTRFGAYTTYLNIHQSYIFPLPSKWTHEEGAGFIAQGLTAYYGLVILGNLKKNDTVLIHSGAGGVGILANRIAKKYNAYTIGTIGNPSKIELLKKEGYNHSIVRSKNFKSDLKSILNEKLIQIVLDAVGGEYFNSGMECLSPMGRYIFYGSATFTPKSNRPNYFKLAYQYLNRPKLDPLKMISENKAFFGFNLIWLWERIEILTEHFNELVKLDIEPQLIGKTYPFLELKNAIQYFKTGESVGKIVINTN